MSRDYLIFIKSVTFEGQSKKGCGTWPLTSVYSAMTSLTVSVNFLCISQQRLSAQPVDIQRTDPDPITRKCFCIIQEHTSYKDAHMKLFLILFPHLSWKLQIITRSPQVTDKSVFLCVYAILLNVVIFYQLSVNFIVHSPFDDTYFINRMLF